MLDSYKDDKDAKYVVRHRRTRQIIMYPHPIDKYIAFIKKRFQDFRKTMPELNFQSLLREYDLTDNNSTVELKESR